MNIAYKKWALYIALPILAVFVFNTRHSFAGSGPCALSQAEVQNASGAKFLDKTTITLTVGGQLFTFIDGDITDSTNHWDVQNSDCYGQIRAPDGYSKITSSSFTLDMDYRPSASDPKPTPIPDVKINIDIVHANDSLVWLTTTSVKNLAYDRAYAQATTPPGVNPQLFLRTDESSCWDVLIVPTGNTVGRLYVLDADITNPAFPPPPNIDYGDVNSTDANIMKGYFPVGCHVTSTYNSDRVGIARDSSGKIKADDIPIGTAPAGTPPPGGTGTTGTAVDKNSCANSADSGGIGLRWVLCPVIELIDRSIQWLDGELQNLLLVSDPSDPAFKANSQLHAAWGNVRNVALIILVPMMLLMVIGTAAGVSFLDAYTVKRAMPRILIAIVFISISWYITAFMINITNVIGSGILGLMTGPFGGGQVSLASLIGKANAAGGGATSGATAGGLLIFGGMLIGGAVSFGIILSYGFVAMLVLLMGFLLLSIRQLLIIVLVLFAPLAILSWAFPNNDALWKLWWGTFSKLLLLFPLIMVLIAGGRIVAYVVALL